MINYRIYILFILILGLVLRLISINQSLWLDEATSALTVRNLSYSQIINNFSPGDFHPPLYYLTLKFWNNIFGNSELSLRSLSVFFGLITIYLTYLVGSVFGKKVGLLSSLLLAINGLHIYYSQEARMYSMSAFLVLLLLLIFMKTLTTKKTNYWFAFSLVLVLNALTDYLPNIVILIFWIYAAIRQRNKDWWKRFLLAHIPILVFGLLWMPYLIRQIHIGLLVKDSSILWWNILGRTDIKNMLLIPVKFVFGRISFTNKNIYFALSALVLAFYSWIIFKSYKKLISNKNLQLIISLFFIPVILSAIIGIKISVFSYFRLIFVLPLFIIILTLSVINLSRKWRAVAFVFLFMVSLFSSLYYLSTPRFHREDWRGLVKYVQDESRNKDYKIVFASDGQTEGFTYYSVFDDVIIKSDYIQPNLNKIWYVRYVWDVFDPEDTVKDKIESQGYIKENVHDFNGIIVWEYENSN